MRCVLDTHFLLWITAGATRLDEYTWLDDYRPWGVSPVSFLEVQFLGEIGKLEVRIDAFVEAVSSDHRFVVDEVPLMRLIDQALPLGWTRDPFDRLLAAHSLSRRVPLCTVDRRMRQHHGYLLKELGPV